MKFIFVLASIIVSNLSFSQDEANSYYEIISIADAHLFNTSYDTALNFYKEAFSKYPQLVKKREVARSIRAAILLTDTSYVNTWIVTLIPENYHLDADTYAELKRINTDTSFSMFIRNNMWKALMNYYSDSAIKKNVQFMDSISRLLENAYDDDQYLRLHLDSIYRNKHNTDFHPNIIDSLSARVSYLDSINLILVSKILDQFGWLGIENIGMKANTALFSIIQHADMQPSVQIKYLPLLKDAANSGKAREQFAAMLVDRISIRESGKQLYGTQVTFNQQSQRHEPRPLISPDNLHVLRASVGLMPIEFYLKLFK